MNNIAHKRRRWRRWSRYINFCCRFGPEIAACRGMSRAHNQRAVWERKRIWRDMKRESG